MNYFRQLNGFKRQRRIKPLTSNAILLYFILLEYANELYFPESFTVANSVLCGLCAFTRSTLTRRRDELINKGYIKYKDGQIGQCGTYKIVPIVFQNAGAYEPISEQHLTPLKNKKDNYKRTYNKFNDFTYNGEADYDLEGFEQRALQKRIEGADYES
ncbi:MAG: helix-turn-helix domain-containing protein [Clostridia bacterium]|nr:helix-turn-helix domain-containing protein [Clostridia bacterium]